MGIVTDEGTKRTIISLKGKGDNPGLYMLNPKGSDEKYTRIRGLTAYFKEAKRKFRELDDYEDYFRWSFFFTEYNQEGEEVEQFEIQVREGTTAWEKMINCFLSIDSPDELYITAYKPQGKKTCTVAMKNDGQNVDWKYDDRKPEHGVPAYGTQARIDFFMNAFINHYPQLTGQQWSGVNVETPATRPIEQQEAEAKRKAAAQMPKNVHATSEQHKIRIVEKAKTILDVNEFLKGWAAAMKYINNNIVDPVHAVEALNQIKDHFKNIGGAGSYELKSDGTYVALDDDDLFW